MNSYQFTATCAVCGGPGAADIRTAAAEWTHPQFIYHKDPSVCRYYLGLKRQEQQKKIAEHYKYAQYPVAP